MHRFLLVQALAGSLCLFAIGCSSSPPAAPPPTEQPAPGGPSTGGPVLPSTPDGAKSEGVTPRRAPPPPPVPPPPK